MSCATLKRPLDSADLFSPTGRGGPTAKKRRLTAAARGLFGIGVGGTGPSTSPLKRGSSSTPVSPFGAQSTLSPEQMSSRLDQEIRYLRRLKRLRLIGLDKEEEASASSHFQKSSASSGPSHFNLENFGEALKKGDGVSKDSPLFTFKQVGLICERLIQEKEESLRREYEQVLSSKLAEQYDTFLKFTHDQIQKQFEAASAPSYLS